MSCPGEKRNEMSGHSDLIFFYEGEFMKTVGGALLGLGLWAVLFLILPQEFLGTVVGRPFQMDDGVVVIRYPWGVVVGLVALVVLPIGGAKVFGEKK